MYPQQNNFYNPYARAQIPSNNIIWVQGIEGAKAQQITPNSSLLLLDSESDHFYMKVCDQYGICMPIKVYKFEEEVPAAAEKIYCLIEDVTEELKDAEQYLLNKRAIDYDMVNIIEEQTKQKEYYDVQCRSLFLN